MCERPLPNQIRHVPAAEIRPEIASSKETNGDLLKSFWFRIFIQFFRSQAREALAEGNSFKKLLAHGLLGAYFSA